VEETTIEKSPIHEILTKFGPSDRGRIRTVDMWQRNIVILDIR
jgi:hypothetical protein